ncbi:TauD/TfdA family dioxygenase [Longispora urticae]
MAAPPEHHLHLTDPAARDFTGRQRDQVGDLVARTGWAYITGAGEFFDHASAVAAFGELMPQRDGQLVVDIKPRPDLEDVRSSLNTSELAPHTENYEFPGVPPAYVALWCVRPAEGPGGETLLVDGHAFLDTLTGEELATARTAVTFTTGEGPARLGLHHSATHPMLEELDHGMGRLLRFSTFEVDRTDPAVDALVGRTVDYFDACRHAVRIEASGLLVWDNWRVLHSRNGFSDPRRHLRRALLRSPLDRFPTLQGV